MDSDIDANDLVVVAAGNMTSAARRKKTIEHIQLDGALEEVIRVPKSLNTFGETSEVFGNRQNFITEAQNSNWYNASTTMSMFASVMTDDAAG